MDMNMNASPPMDESGPKHREDEGRNVTFWGGPGTGKTCSLLDQWEKVSLQNPESGAALFLAATGVGAGEIVRQASERTDAVKELLSPRVVTPPIMANHVLRHGGAHFVGLDPDYTVWSRPQARQMFTEAIRATASGRALSPSEIERIYRLYRRRKAGFQDSGNPGDITGPTGAYEVLQDSCSCLDIDDLVLLAVQALQENAKFRDLFCRNEGEILVIDDLHLLSPAAFDLALLIRGSARYVSVAVDLNLPAGWARLEFIDRVMRLLSGYLNVENKHLDHTHRHGGPLAKLVRGFAAHGTTKGLVSVEFEATRSEGPVPVIARVSADPAKIARFVHDWVQEMLHLGYEWKDVACICLDASLVDLLRDALDRRGVPCDVPGGLGPEREPVTERALGLLTWLLNHRDRRAFADAVFTGSVGIPEVVIRQVVQKIFDESRPPGIDLIQTIHDLAQDFSPDDALHQRLIWVADAHRRLVGMVHDAPVADQVRLALELSGLDPGDSSTVEARALMDTAQMFETDEKGPAALGNFLDRCHPDMRLETEQTGSGLTLVSLGYDEVGYWPAACVIDTVTPHEDEEDRNRGVFAALTRATDELVYVVGDVDRLADPGEPYLNALQEALEQVHAGESGLEAQAGRDPEPDDPIPNSRNHESREEPDVPEENRRPAVCVPPEADSADPTGPAQEPRAVGQRRPTQGVGPADPRTPPVRPPDAGAGRARRPPRDVRRDDWRYGYSKGRGEFPIRIDWACLVPVIIVTGLVVALAVYTVRAFMG